jgi:hypothetical protein
LVDDNLSTVGEVTELGLPKTKRVGVGLGVAILKTEDCKFGEMRACCNKLSNVVGAAESLLDRTVVTILVLVEDVSVSV